MRGTRSEIIIAAGKQGVPGYFVSGAVEDINGDTVGLKAIDRATATFNIRMGTHL